MRSLGMVEFELRNYRDSAAWLERALAATTAPLDADLASQTTHLLARARGFIGTLKLQVEPGKASVRVDGTLVHPDAQGQLSLEAGDHVVELRASGFITERHPLKVQGGDVQRWKVQLAPEAGATPQEEALYAGHAPEQQRTTPNGRSFVHVVPRFTLVMPGSGDVDYAATCTNFSCDTDGSETINAHRGAMPMLGADLMFSLRTDLWVGLGFHAQLNKSDWKVDEDDDSIELGRSFWLPASAEYRVDLGGNLTLPLRALVGLGILQAGSGFDELVAELEDECESARDDGLSCSATGSPGLGTVIGAGPGIVVPVGDFALRGDLWLGYSWTRIAKLEVSGDGAALEEKFTTGTFLAALSVGVEL
ncbi:MAG: hypothetical protein RL385_3535 [Pseudomonadota bacterium]|jgi:hypothetical protein